MRFVVVVLVSCTLGAVVAPRARAGDDADLRREVDALRRRVEEQDRRLREMSGASMTQDEVAAALERFLAATPQPATLVGGAEGGKAGWPQGGAPFIGEGPNKIQFHFRNQARYEAFLYSGDAVGTLASPANTLSDAAPRDRSGFEIERLHLGVDGSFLCPELTFNLTLDFEADEKSGVTRKFAYLDYRYSGEHHVRAGVDKVCATYEDQNSTGALAFVDRGLYSTAFRLDFDTGMSLWGHFGDGERPRRFLYKVMASTGEGQPQAVGSVFSADAFDTYTDELLLSGLVEWNVTGKDWKHDEVDNRPCDERCRLDASLGAWGYYEDDDDASTRMPGGLALRSTGPLERWAAGAWFRARYEGWSLVAEAGTRHVDYTAGSTAKTQADYGAELMVHHRFAQSNWGVGAKAGVLWLDDDYDTLTVGADTVAIEDTITEVGLVVNYFFSDHHHKASADVTWVRDNSGVNSSGPGYLWGAPRGVLVEDGVMLRFQWQLSF